MVKTEKTSWAGAYRARGNRDGKYGRCRTGGLVLRTRERWVAWAVVTIESTGRTGKTWSLGEQTRLLRVGEDGGRRAPALQFGEVWPVVDDALCGGAEVEPVDGHNLDQLLAPGRAQCLELLLCGNGIALVVRVDDGVRRPVIQRLDFRSTSLIIVSTA